MSKHTPQRSFGTHLFLRGQADRLSSGVLRLLAILFWLVIWQLAALFVGKQFILPSPLETLGCLGTLIGTGEFWVITAHSLLHIALGFFSALVGGILASVASYRIRLIKTLISPLIAAIKSIPVASFVILLLVWMHASYLSVAVAHLIAFPIIYTNLLRGLESTDTKLLEMADIFQIQGCARIRSLYLSQVLPYFEAATSLALGFCWKAGIAAEVISTPASSIGEELYSAKVFLDTPNLFAWTVVIVCISALIEKGFSRLIRMIVRRIEEGA